MSIILRPYQHELINMCIDKLKSGHKRPLLVLPTGGGKTAIASELIKRSFDKGKKSIFVCHRQELIKQTVLAYNKIGLNPAVIRAGVDPDYDNPLQIASINTLANRLEKVHRPDVMIWDECQHQSANTWAKVSDYYNGAVMVGLSATPCRLDGKPLGSHFDCMCKCVSTKDLIDLHFLTKYKYYAPSNINTAELKMGGNGDYTRESIASASFNNKIVGDNIEHYKKIASGKRNIVFAPNCKQGKIIAERYNEAGIAAAFLDGTTDKDERADCIEAFSKGAIKVLVNVDLFGEGFDLPAIECVSLLRPTASTSLYLQQVGRALRTCDNKEYAIILDHVNNYQRHGMPDDEREWTLDGGLVRSRGKTSSIAIKRCPHCFFAHPPALECPNCGYIYNADGKQIKEVSGELVLVGSERAKELEYKQLKEADTLNDLVTIESERGYKTGWAERMYLQKHGRNLWGTREGLEEIARARGYNNGWVWLRWVKIRGNKK